VHGDRLRCYLGGLDDVLAQWRDPDALLAATLAIASEQALNPDSRVRLGTATDRFGHRRIELDWRYSEIDFHTIRTAAIAFGELLARRDVGRLKLGDWLLDGAMAFPGTGEAQVAGPHHMCTTRMSEDPRQGVVDRNCKVHGMDNLYLGGSSVFATGGAANRTFTVVRLALRLADHLAAAA
jgi:choline dehydrogenase-like flavoprotein